MRKVNSCFISNPDITFHLSDQWCKVKAMNFIDDFLFGKSPSNRSSSLIKAVLFLDSDAVITIDGNYSLSRVVEFMQRDLRWSASTRPFAVNQDGPGWACKATMKRGFGQCLNSGTVLWFRSQTATDILRYWWGLAGADGTAPDIGEHRRLGHEASRRKSRRKRRSHIHSSNITSEGSWPSSLK
jgi:hypothetical protein